jgi:hypothetical protein
VCLLLVVSCATVPPPQEPPDWVSLLPAESTLVAGVDVAAARGLLDELAGRVGLESRRIADILSRTRRAYAGIQLLPDGPPLISMVALGDFCPAALDLRLSFDRRWHKRMLNGTAGPEAAACFTGGGPGEAANRRGPTPWDPAGTYWEASAALLPSASGGLPAASPQLQGTVEPLPGAPQQAAPGRLEIASPRRGVVLLSTGAMESLLRRFEVPAGTILPEETARDVRGADLFLFLRELPRGAMGGEVLRTPIRSLWLAARADQGDYVITAVFTLEGVSNERALERLFRLLIPALLRRAGVPDPLGTFKALELSVEPARVRVRNLRLSAGDLLRFFAQFAGLEDGTDGGSR